MGRFISAIFARTSWRAVWPWLHPSTSSSPPLGCFTSVKILPAAHILFSGQIPGLSVFKMKVSTWSGDWSDAVSPAAVISGRKFELQPQQNHPI